MLAEGGIEERGADSCERMGSGGKWEDTASMIDDELESRLGK